MKKVIILKTNDGELANQLWNYASVYAYCLERGYTLRNYAFYEYGSYFNIPVGSWFFKTFFFQPLAGNTKRKWSGQKRLWRLGYRIVAKIILLARAARAIVIKNDSQENQPLDRIYLPPTTEPSANLKKLEQTQGDILLRGWLFRNPVGLEKYRQEIRTYFQPNPTIQKSVADFISPLKTGYRHLIGVHLRQGDYKKWRGGQYFIDERRMQEVLQEYLRETGLNPSEVCFIIASDEKIDASIFAGLNIKTTSSGMVEDLFILASTEAIIGSDSTFGDFAAYYANIPHIIATKAPVDWSYYRGKIAFFQNKYCSWVHY